MSAAEDDFASNIDEQLLNSVDSHQDSRIKLEDIAHAAEASKAQQQAQSQMQHDQQLEQQSPQHQQHPQQSIVKKEQKRQTRRNNRASANTLPSQHQPAQPTALDEDEFRKFQLQQQAQQTSEQFVRQQQQALAAAAAAAAELNNYGNPHPSTRHHPHPHHHHGGPQLPDLSAPSTDELAEYNIQIPDPIVDNRSKIFPVEENTITAEGNLITRPYPEQIFQSRDDLNEFIADFARDNGFGVVIAHSNKKAIYYTCELGGRYRHKKTKKIDESKQVDVGEGYMLDPDTKTKKLKCPYAMTASYKKSTGIWTLRTTCNEHNHPQLDPLSNHPMLRKRSDELNVLILDLYKLGTKPSHIESKIRESYPDLAIKREDIYNEIRGYKRKLKKQNSRFGFNNPSRIANAQYRKKAAQQAAAAAAAAAAAVPGSGGVIGNGSGSGNDTADAVAAVTAAANANAFLSDGQDITNYEAFHNQQQSQQEQRNQQAQHLQQQAQQQVQQQQTQHQQTQNQQQDQAQQEQEEFQRQFVAATQAQQHHQLDDHQYQQYQQHLQDQANRVHQQQLSQHPHSHAHHHHNHHHGLTDSDGSAAAAIAAVAAASGVNVGRQLHHHQSPQQQSQQQEQSQQQQQQQQSSSQQPHANTYQDGADLSMDNIDTRLVGE
ncbi:hypothetical protein K4G60_g485 [Candida parapsilosis]|nr:hypothetical protein K4G60_g485 [Candida parapsilosis]KAI5906555.1 hypothetical protein K4G61_g214 [Candida parapsilosis]CAD1808163.1 unnamed protein product [Candida parapsilosis]